MTIRMSFFIWEYNKLF